MAECIYCRFTTDARRFATPEHVIPKAYGRFQGNFTIFCVCESCNQWFGDNLEVSFNRNSGEALMRLLSGVKSPHEAAEIGGDRLHVVAGDGAKFAGAKSYFKPHTDGTKVVASFVPHVGFAPSEHDEPVLFAESELTREVVAKYSSCECFVIGETEEDFQRLASKLTDLGCQSESVLWCPPNTSLPLVLEPVRVDYRLDDEVFRTVGKIAFNYLAHAVGAEFCLSRDFDAFRRFVRYGEGDWRRFMTLSQEPLLFDERRTGTRQTRGHLLVVEWRRGAAAPTASVKLFNGIHYRVRFAEECSMIWRGIRSGHHFNIRTLKIERIKILAIEF
ncbi:MAG: HNH endonuclease [Acidobacteriota bacterium]